MLELAKEKEKFIYALFVALLFSVACILIHVLFIIFPIQKYDWSVYPRDIQQWYGILTGQFIHASWGHLFSNLPPLFVSSLVLFYFYRSIGWAGFILILLLTGFMVFYLVEIIRT